MWELPSVSTSVVSSLSVVCVNVSSVSYSSCAITIMSCSRIIYSRMFWPCTTLFRLCVLSFLYCCCTELHIIPAKVVESRGNADSAISTRLHKVDLLANLSLAWRLAAENIQAAQNRQKKYYDRSANEINLKVGDRVMVYMPSELRGEEHKLRRPFHGPY